MHVHPVTDVLFSIDVLRKGGRKRRLLGAIFGTLLPLKALGWLSFRKMALGLLSEESLFQLLELLLFVRYVTRL